MSGALIQSDANAAQLTRPIDFIANGDFESTAEADFQEIDFELYAAEDQTPGSLDAIAIDHSPVCVVFRYQHCPVQAVNPGRQPRFGGLPCRAGKWNDWI